MPNASDNRSWLDFLSSKQLHKIQWLQQEESRSCRQRCWRIICCTSIIPLARESSKWRSSSGARDKCHASRPIAKSVTGKNGKTPCKVTLDRNCGCIKHTAPTGIPAKCSHLPCPSSRFIGKSNLARRNRHSQQKHFAGISGRRIRRTYPHPPTVRKWRVPAPR